jgi:hypothetical protein
MFSGIISTANAKKAAPVAGAVFLAITFTQGRSKLWQGAAAVAAAMIALPLASKL